MTVGKTNTNLKNMTVGNPAKLILAFSVPLMIGNIFQQLYTVVDTMVVGQVLGNRALAALGTTDWFNWMFLGIMSGLTQGFSILIARKFGEEDLDGMRKATGNAILLSGILAVFLVVAGEMLVIPVLQILKAPADIMPVAAAYLRIVFGGMLVVMAYNILAAILRALGDSRSPLQAMMLAAVINVGLDFLFVAVFHWGVQGAAIATVAAQFCSALFCLQKIRKTDIMKFKKTDFLPERKLVFRLLYLGSPMALQNVLISIGGMIVQAVVNGFGVMFIAAFTATNKLYGVLEIAAISFGYAMTTYTGQNLGAGKIDRIRKGTKDAALIGIVTAVAITLCMYLFGKSLLGLFISGTEAERQATVGMAFEYLWVMSVFLPVLYVLHVVRSAVQGMGRSVLTMLSGFAEFLVRTSVALLLPALIGYQALFYGEVLAWIGAVAELLIAYFWSVRQLAKQKFAKKNT